MSDPATVLSPGSKIADTYEVVRLIGRGGMGEVWLARHLRLPGKQVAIKVLHTRTGGLSADALARFRREAEVATRIGHPNIVEVHDYNTLPSGAPYLVLEFLQGESLASRLRFGPMPLEEATPLIRQVGSALDASHQQGVVHRDLKPDNIFLVPTPMGTEVKVLDFGISKVVDSATLQTADEVLIGTPQYMSPEQATGQNKEVGPQTDVFALASIIYEMLSGQPPFAAESVARIVFRIAYEPHAPLQSVKPGLPDRVYLAIERALQKDRAKRYESIAAFITELTGQPVPRTLPPASQGAEQSGVARPGMATPDSMAWGATAAPGSSEAHAKATPAPHAPARKAGNALKRAAIGLGALVVALVGVVVLKAPPPQNSEPLTVPAPPPVAAAVAMLDAGVKETGEEGDAGAAVAAAVAVAPKPTPAVAKKIPPEELEVLKDMEQRLEEKNPVQRVSQLFRSLSSEAGIARGWVIAGIAGCKEQDLGVARSYFSRLTDRSERQRLTAGCKQYGMDVR